MFICAKGHVSKPREPQVLIVTERRLRVYENYIDGEVRVTKGWEVVKETAYCPSCAAKL